MREKINIILHKNILINGDLETTFLKTTPKQPVNIFLPHCSSKMNSI